MAEENIKDKYIICSGCKSKYINDEEHISKDFGYTRLEERYKTCVKCKARNNINSKKYHEIHKEERNQNSKKYHEIHKEEIKQYREEHKEYFKEYNKRYREEHNEYLKEYDKERNKIRNEIKIKCPNCNSEICKKNLTAHQRTQTCKLITESKNTQI